MALYAMGDTHLSLSVNKSMEVFGGAWNGYVDKLREGLSILREEDTLVLCGDISWGMSLEDTRSDFAFLEFPGRKIILKGNHDYWWNTASKMERFWQESGFSRLSVLHNNCHFYGRPPCAAPGAGSMRRTRGATTRRSFGGSSSGWRPR